MKLSPAEIEQRLEKLDGWSLQGDAIKKQFTFAGFPEAVALKLAGVPETFVRSVGCAVTAGGTQMVRSAGELVTAPTELLSTTAYGPALEGWTLVNVRVEPVLFEIGAPLKVHWYAGGGMPAAATEKDAVVPMMLVRL